MSTETTGTIFISYRRDNIGKMFSQRLKETLTNKKYEVFLDVDCLRDGPWKDQILAQVSSCNHFLLLLTPGALDKCGEEDDCLRYEFVEAYRHCRNIVPVIWELSDIDKLEELAHVSMKPAFRFQTVPIRHESFESDIDKMLTRFIAPRGKAAGAGALPAVSFRPEIRQITTNFQTELFGREVEIDYLYDAWCKAVKGEPNRPHVIAYVAPGGAGKTSLVAKWAWDITKGDNPLCNTAYAWSFYNSGIAGSAAASSDDFLSNALNYFGDTTHAGTVSARNKGERLAELVDKHHALLILDGLEPLQCAPTSSMPGELTDAGLVALLTGLSLRNRGLCVITTRYSIPNLYFGQANTPEKDLSRLSTDAGVKLLESLGVKNAEAEQVAFKQLVEDMHGHALTLNLIGAYLAFAHDGEIRKRDQVKLEEADNSPQKGRAFRVGHAFRVMDAYVRWLESDGENSQRALSMLSLLGLFDRPASADCLDALLEAPAIPGLTDVLIGLSKDQRRPVYSLLQATKLLTVNRDKSGALVALDAHPLVREYFAGRLRKLDADASWCAAHLRLFEHLCKSTESIPKKVPNPTLNDLQPLYQAITHGCFAKEYRKAHDEIFQYKILQWSKCHSMKNLGAVELDLKAISCFFEEPWSRISTKFTNDDDQGWLLNEAASRLYALGRLREADSLMQAGLDARVAQKHKNARQKAESGGCLSELKLTMGMVNDAIKLAEQSVTDSIPSGDTWFQRAMLGMHAFALHQSGKQGEAKALFANAEKILVEKQPDSVFYFQYCELLFTPIERTAWQVMCDDVSRALKISAAHKKLLHHAQNNVAQRNKGKESISNNPDLLSIALDHLMLGRAALYEAVVGNISPDCRKNIDIAVDGLRRAARNDYLPGALLTRAWLRSLESNFTGSDSAKTDLDEAFNIAERGPMPLFLADIHLYRARLFGGKRAKAKNVEYPRPWVSPQSDLEEARRLIGKHGYGRREAELEDAETLIK